MSDTPEVAAYKARWAAEALKRLDDNIAACVHGIEDPSADRAYTALVARLTAIVEQGAALAGTPRK